MTTGENATLSKVHGEGTGTCTSSNMSVAAEAVLIPAFLTAFEIDFLLNDCERLVSRDPEADLSDRGAAIDPWEHIAVSTNSTERFDVQSYENRRLRSIDGESSCGPESILLFHELIFQRLPTLLRSILQLASTQQLYLFNEHYVFKQPCSNLAFRWHRDADEQLLALMTTTSSCSQIDEYFSCWINLDEVNAENGSIALLSAVSESGPFTLLSSDSAAVVPPDSKQIGNAVAAVPGSVVIFSSRTWHRSGINRTDSPRRVYYVQYSLQPIMVKETGRDYILSFAIPC